MSLPHFLSVAVCDDDPGFAAQVCRLLDRCLEGTPHRIDLFTDPEDLLQAAALRGFGLAVLDIQMPRRDGIALAQRLLALRPGCRILFLTAYIAYCQDVYQVPHLAFVLKSEMEQRLPAAVDRALARPEPNARPLAALVSGGIQMLPQNDIVYLERRVRTTWIHTLSGPVAVPEKLEVLLQRLDPVRFCQTHKSYAVHWLYAERYDRSAVRMSGGDLIPISRAHAAAVRQSFLRYADSLPLTEDAL